MTTATKSLHSTPPFAGWMTHVTFADIMRQLKNDYIDLVRFEFEHGPWDSNICQEMLTRSKWAHFAGNASLTASLVSSVPWALSPRPRPGHPLLEKVVWWAHGGLLLAGTALWILEKLRADRLDQLIDQNCWHPYPQDITVSDLRSARIPTVRGDTIERDFTPEFLAAGAVLGGLVMAGIRAGGTWAAARLVPTATRIAPTLSAIGTWYWHGVWGL